MRIKKGLDLPITGTPQQVIEDKPVTEVAVLGPDYIGMRPNLQVQEGDCVKRGQILFCDKKSPEICFTAPAGGVVDAIHRGEKRTLLSVVIRLDANEDAISFSLYPPAELLSLNEQQVRENLLQSGLWTAFRTRPFSKVPAPDSIPYSIFINAMDSNPLAADPVVVITEHGQDFENGLRVLARLGTGALYLCKAAGSSIPYPDLDQLLVQEFTGPHPAGLPGTHIHMLDPVNKHKTVWSINYQDVIAIGKLFTTGELFVERVISLVGPQVTQPRLLRVRLGAAIDDLVSGELKAGENRIVSGSVLYGYEASEKTAYLGRYHLQVSVLQEVREKEFMAWLQPGKEKFSILNIFTSRFIRGKRFDFSTMVNGEHRAMVPVGSYENVMPLDILPTQLLRALIVKDTDTAQALGCLELDEEDLALCTYVCPGKYDYGLLLRECLNRIEKEG
ncbi:MAG: Na(+)-translocating NADH-quinone reductase subunit A [Gammaproteobacteria bacterium]|nr:Na(+)-translocating NADH-quinone reductase subunit A [Gammaproteobacteria bacterium]MCF6260706.1 Na(+)-translocating NADH-quinone reductase subunit A [Gammaproteobacteria bacterium]